MEVLKLLGLLIVLIHLTVYGIILMMMPIPYDDSSLEKFKIKWLLARTLIGRLLLKWAISFAVEKEFDLLTIRVGGFICFSGGLFFSIATLSGLLDT